MAYVYRHIRLDKNEVFYVGIGSDKRNYKRAKECSRRSDLWKKVISKTDWIFEIIADDISFEKAKEKEIEFIKLYGRKDLKNGTLVNLTDGGDGTINKVFTEEYRKKLSISAKKRILSEDQKEKLRNYRKNIKNSPEARLKISLANKGKKKPQKIIDLLKLRTGCNNPNYGKKGCKSKKFKGFIDVYKEGVFIGKYEGVHDAARELNVSASKISAVLNNKRNHTGGYFFKRIPII